MILNDFAHVNGGAAQVAISSAEGLASHGHRVIFFSAVPPVSDTLQRHGIRSIVTEQFEIKKDPSRIRAAVQGIWNRSAASKFAAALTHLDPHNTVVHVHGWSKSLSSSPIREAVERGFNVVCTLHDYFYTCPNGGFYNFQEQKICSLKPLSASCVLEHCDRDGYPQKLWRCARQTVQDRWGFSGVQNFIFLSEFSRAKISSYLPSDARLFHIPNPIVTVKRPRVDVGANQRFIAIGRVSPEKGYHLFAEAVSGTDITARIVGDGPDRDRLMARWPDVEITGWQTRAEVESEFQHARALVFPSVWYEAQPLSVLEAAAMGVPAIVADTCAARESVVNGETGLWFKGESVQDLREKLRLLQDSAYADYLGANAYQRYWNAPLDLQKHITALESCYQELIG